MSKKRKGPTPKRRQPRTVWMAKCERCGVLDRIDRGDAPSPLNHTPCLVCGNDCARYVEVTL